MRISILSKAKYNLSQPPDCLGITDTHAIEMHLYVYLARALTYIYVRMIRTTLVICVLVSLMTVEMASLISVKYCFKSLIVTATHCGLAIHMVRRLIASYLIQL